jgi:DNA-binding NarL/FixJ family response regulator
MFADSGVPATDAKISVMIVENQAVFRKGLLAQFATDPAIEVIAELGIAAEAVREALALRPSVVLMDLYLPWLPGARPTYCGAKAINQIRQNWPEANIAVMTMYDEEERVREALKAGARSYVLKTGELDEVVLVVRLTARGTAVLCREARDVVTKLLPHSTNGSTSFPELGVRENELLSLAAAGASDRQIADRLHISTKTVRNYWTNIRQKLRASSREDAVQMAQANSFRPDGSGSPG